MPNLLLQTLREIVPKLNDASRSSGWGGWRLLWEARATVRSNAHRAGLYLEIDGGARVERIEPSAPGPAFRFAVGAGPLGALELASSAVGSPMPSWDDLISQLATELINAHHRAIHDLAGGSQDAESLGPNDNALETLGRARVLTSPDVEPCVDVSIGHRLQSGPGQFRREPALLFGPGTPPPRFDVDLWGLHGSSSSLSQEQVGPVVLSSQAAGWAAHELGHAALENAFRLPPDLGLQLLDDPQQAPWPAGFLIDDHGHSARRLELNLGATASYRRPSVRDRAIPSMTFTSIVLNQHRQLRQSDLELGTIVVDSVRAGRFDSLSKLIVLEARRFYRVKADGTLGDTGHAGLVVLDEASWRGVMEVLEGPRYRPELALCTRAGAMNAVMVGAPTIVLEPARLIPLNHSQDGGNQGL